MTDFPDTLQIFLTNDCNLRCSYCFVSKEACRNRELDTEEIKAAIGFFLRSSPRQKIISFSGGEPLRRPAKLKELLRVLSRDGALRQDVACVDVVTNGTLLEGDVARWLNVEGVGLTISMDGKRETHDAARPWRFRQKGSSHARVVRNLKPLFRRDPGRLKASLVFTPSNVQDLLANIQYLRQLGFRSIDFYPALYSRWSSQALDALDTQFGRLCRYYLHLFRRARKKEDVFSCAALRHLTGGRLYGPFICRKVSLCWDGQYYCCDKALSLPWAQRKPFIVGSAPEGFDNKLRLRLLRRQRREIKRITGQDCSACACVPYCFCPIGHHIYFSSRGVDFKRYFPIFCRISRITISNFYKVWQQLKCDPLFAEIYNVPPAPLCHP